MQNSRILLFCGLQLYLMPSGGENKRLPGLAGGISYTLGKLTHSYQASARKDSYGCYW